MTEENVADQIVQFVNDKGGEADQYQIVNKFGVVALDTLPRLEHAGRLKCSDRNVWRLA